MKKLIAILILGFFVIIEDFGLEALIDSSLGVKTVSLSCLLSKDC